MTQLKCFRRRTAVASARLALLPFLCVPLLLIPLADGASAEPTTSRSYTTYGTPGLIDMPTAEMAPDGDFAATIAYAADQRRNTLTFQLAPRISGSFRYSVIPDFDGVFDRFDRSFDLRYQLLSEGTWLPAVAIGFQDFIGTGLYSGEYVVATKTFGRFNDVRVTGGLGWGRLATAGVIAREETVRDTEFEETGGTANFDQYFTGPISAFGGIAWNVTDKLTFKAEYSSDGYIAEQERDLVDIDSPWNFGVDYEIIEGARIGAYSLYGTEFGVQVTLMLNPNDPPLGPGFDSAPTPVAPRPDRNANPVAWTEEWVVNDLAQSQVRENVVLLLEAEGIELESIALRANEAIVRMRNARYGSQAQAMGRSLRALSRALPASIELITLVPVVNGVPSAAVTFRRSDVERLENAPAQVILDQAVFLSGAGPAPADLMQVDPYPNFFYGVGPYLELSFFDPDDPLRYFLGLEIGGEIELARGFVASAAIRQPVVGTIDDVTREANSALPQVRSNWPEFVDDMGPTLDQMQLAYYARPGTDLYGRVTGGLLERMYGGVSTELLWKPPDSRIAVGGELNYAQQRDPDDTFGFGDYDIVTGHASVYYEMANGYYAQVDAGRYLAGDYGATFTLERVFDSGWRLGAFATFTDVPFDEFGEGSFDKGIRVSVPVSWAVGEPTRRGYTTVLRPVTRDGGARLFVAGRLYDRVREAHKPSVDARGGRFWR